MPGKKRTYRSSIKHLIYNLKKLQFSINKRGGKIPIDLCICRYRLEEYAKVIDILERKGYRVSKEGLEYINKNYVQMDIPIIHPLRNRVYPSKPIDHVKDFEKESNFQFDKPVF